MSPTSRDVVRFLALFALFVAIGAVLEPTQSSLNSLVLAGTVTILHRLNNPRKPDQ